MFNYFVESVNHYESSYDKLVAFVEAFFTLSNDEPIVGGCPIFNAAIEMDYLINWLCGIIQQGIVKNELAHHIEPKTVALYILSTVEGALVISRLHEDREVLSIIKQQLIAYLFSLSS